MKEDSKVGKRANLIRFLTQSPTHESQKDNMDESEFLSDISEIDKDQNLRVKSNPETKRNFKFVPYMAERDIRGNLQSGANKINPKNKTNKGPVAPQSIDKYNNKIVSKPNVPQMRAIKQYKGVIELRKEFNQRIDQAYNQQFN